MYVYVYICIYIYILLSVYVKMKFFTKMSQAMVLIGLFLEKRRGTEDAKK